MSQRSIYEKVILQNNFTNTNLGTMNKQFDWIEISIQRTPFAVIYFEKKVKKPYVDTFFTFNNYCHAELWLSKTLRSDGQNHTDISVLTKLVYKTDQYKVNIVTC